MRMSGDNGQDAAPLCVATFEADSDKLSDDDLKWISDANDLKQLENNKSPI